MNDYISRRAAIKEVWDMVDVLGHDGCVKKIDVEDVLNSMPTDDVRENVSGEWIRHPDNREWDVCTACGIGCKRREYGENADGTEWVTEYSYSHCPYCGADMRVGQIEGN